MSREYHIGKFGFDQLTGRAVVYFGADGEQYELWDNAAHLILDLPEDQFCYALILTKAGTLTMSSRVTKEGAAYVQENMDLPIVRDVYKEKKNVLN